MWGYPGSRSQSLPLADHTPWLVRVLRFVQQCWHGILLKTEVVVTSIIMVDNLSLGSAYFHIGLGDVILIVDRDPEDMVRGVGWWWYRRRGCIVRIIYLSVCGGCPCWKVEMSTSWYPLEMSSTVIVVAKTVLYVEFMHWHRGWHAKKRQMPFIHGAIGRILYLTKK